MARSGARHGLARALSKRGICSRTQGATWVREGRVSVDGRRVTDPEHPVDVASARIEVDGLVLAPRRRYLMLNKPRGVVTTAADERGRATVYRCFDGSDLGWIAPVGRLDKASEGLLLFTNDPAWAGAVTDPATGPDKTYHVQVDRLPDDAVLQRLAAGIEVDGELLRAKSVRLLRCGGRTAWLEFVLDEGRNRQIRRLLGAVDLEVLRLVRVAIGGLVLGTLEKREWRELDAADMALLGAGAALG